MCTRENFFRIFREVLVGLKISKIRGKNGGGTSAGIFFKSWFYR